MFETQTDDKTKTAAKGSSLLTEAATGKNSPGANPVWQSLALRPVGIQPKLVISQPGDPYEREADRVADQVMRAPINNANTFGLSSAQTSPKAQRQFTSAVPVQMRLSPAIQLKPDPKPKPKEEPKVVPATVDNVDDLYGPLSEDIAKQVFEAYGGALTGNEKGLISAFTGQSLSGWLGLAIIMQESSFANKENNPSIDERNIANPFSVHFNTNIKKWPKGCGKNLLLIEEAGKDYTPGKTVNKDCAAKGFRLPTFAESAQASAKTMAKLAKGKGGIDDYREEGGYKKDLNARLNNILNKINLKPK